MSLHRVPSSLPQLQHRVKYQEHWPLITRATASLITITTHQRVYPTQLLRGLPPYYHHYYAPFTRGVRWGERHHAPLYIDPYSTWPSPGTLPTYNPMPQYEMVFLHLALRGRSCILSFFFLSRSLSAVNSAQWLIIWSGTAVVRYSISRFQQNRKRGRKRCSLNPREVGG